MNKPTFMIPIKNEVEYALLSHFFSSLILQTLFFFDNKIRAIRLGHFEIWIEKEAKYALTLTLKHKSARILQHSCFIISLFY